MTINDTLSLYCRAKYPLLWVQTAEEYRFVKIVQAVSKDLNRKMYCWTVTKGLRDEQGELQGGPTTMELSKALDEVEKGNEPAIYLVKDPAKDMESARTARKFRDLYQNLKNRRKTVIIVSPVLAIPETLKEEITLVDFELPDAEELGTILKTAVEDLGEVEDEKAKQVYKKIRPQMDKHFDNLVQAMTGLTSEVADNIVAKCIAQHEMDVDTILGEKKQAIRKGGLLEYYDPKNLPEVGGLANLKQWFATRQDTFSEEARAYGLPTPKGVILLGVPGTGKSLVAKTIAKQWGMPLLKLDMGSMFGSLVGQTEAQIRNALKQAEAMSPCVLFVDEIDKGLAGMSEAGGDGGTSKRMGGTFLTWMQEKTAPVFVIATANNIALLPPEFKRKGRFDEIFFLDIPTESERKEIFEVQFRRFKHDQKKLDVQKLVEESKNFTGAEIEAAIVDAMYVAFSEKARKITTEDVVWAIQKTVPQYESEKENIANLRRWIQEGRAVSASVKDEGTAAQRKGRIVEV